MEQEEATEVKKGSWLSRGLNKLSEAASTVKTKTASLLDFHSGAADIVCVKHKVSLFHRTWSFCWVELLKQGVVLPSDCFDVGLSRMERFCAQASTFMWRETRRAPCGMRLSTFPSTVKRPSSAWC